ncbi:MAG TPA: class I SAM-dependent methyltransferase [Chthoniobacterales bacterium]|jgi:predicted O-methyltransferase YrrM
MFPANSNRTPLYRAKRHSEIDDCLEIMHKLIEYRHNKMLHHQLMKAADYSMLSVDVLVLLYHFAKICEENILEIGAFLGASTVAAGMGARDSGKRKKFISIELGGEMKDHHLATKNIFRDLEKNVARAGLLDAVTLINDSSHSEKTLATVREMMGPGEVGLFIFDAHGNVRYDLDLYGDRLAHRCWVVIDDYLGAADKVGPTRIQVDDLVRAGRLLPLGFYGWGTWVGQWSID